MGYNIDRRFSPTTFAITKNMVLPIEDKDISAWDSGGNYYIKEEVNPGGALGMHSQAGVAKYSGNHRKWHYFWDDYWHEYYSLSNIHQIAIDSEQNVFCVIDYTYTDTAFGTTLSGVRVIRLSSAGSVVWENSEENEVSQSTKCIAVSGQGFCIAKWLDTESVSQIVAFSAAGNALWSKSGYGGGNGAQMHIGADGFIYIRDDNGLHKLNISGNLVWSNTEVAQ